MSAKTSDSSRSSRDDSDPTEELHADDGRRAASAIPDAREDLLQLADRLRQATLAVTWRQWRALGAGAAGRPSVTPSGYEQKDIRRHLHTLVDPEALVLVSLMLLDHERRLGDLLHDWGARNSDLLSVQRMKNLEAHYPEPVRGVLTNRLAWFATVARDEGKDSRWRSLVQSEPIIEDVLPARAYGAHAPLDAPIKTRAARARLVVDATLMLRLRLGLGVGVKADIIAFLLTRMAELATVRGIADATGYTVAAVRRAADDLAAARLIESLDGQPTGYRAINKAWAPLLGFRDGCPRWASWHERFCFVTAFLHWADVAREWSLSAYAFGAQGRGIMERHRPAFERDHIAAWSAHSPILDWGAFVGQSVRSLASWMEEMG